MESREYWVAAIGAAVLFVVFNAVQLVIAYVVQSRELDHMREREFRRRKRKARARAVAALIKKRAAEAADGIAAALNINPMTRKEEFKNLRALCRDELERYERARTRGS